MARRYAGNMNGERYLGNTENKEVHDLDNEQTGANQCRIEDIIAAEHDVPFHSRFAAHGRGYHECAHCLGGATR